MAVGLPMKTTYADGDVWSASDVDDITGTINLVGQTNNFYAGKNRVINGDFGVWQRGTSFASPGDGVYTADRFITYQNGTGFTRTISQQTFTAGTAPVSGYEGTYFFRYLCSALGTGNTYQAIQNRVEDVRTFAGQTATFSFWAKADSAKTITLNISQNFGSGGSTAVAVNTTTTYTLSTSWTRYTTTVSVPSIAGKTIGTSSFLQVGFELGSQTITFDTWGWQLEAGSTATAFQTATGTKQGELAACQRYYNRIIATGSIYAKMGTGLAASTTLAQIVVPFPVEMRVVPTSVDYSTLGLYDGGLVAITAVALDGQNARAGGVSCTSSGLTVYRPYILISNASANGYLGFSAEL